MAKTRRFSERSLRRVALPLLVFLVATLFIEWAVVAGHAPMSVARPSAVVRLLFREHAGLLGQLLPTLVVAGWGFLLALVLALTVGFVTHAFSLLERPVLVTGTVLSSVPIIAIAPILSVWFGLGLPTRIMITVLICVFPLLLSVIQGLKSASASQQELFSVLAASAWQRFRLLALPGSLSFLFVGMKISAPLAVLGALVAEWNGAEAGLGVAMLNAMFGLQITRLWATVVIACLISSLAYAWICLMEQRVVGPVARPEELA
jgi:ABC-type nitrate/sulfonate/bicarbonate transport system permease component